MPVVPSNDNPWRVSETASAVGDFRINDRPQTEYGAEYVKKNLDAGAARINKAAEEYRADVDKTRVIDAVVQFDRERQALKDDYTQNRTGKSALELRDGKTLEEEQGEKLKASYDKILEGLGNGRQRELFSRLGAQVLIGHNREVGAFKSRQYQVYRGSVYQQIQNDALSKVLSDDADTREAGMQTLESLVGELAKSSGKTEAEVRRTVLGGAHGVLISGMLERGDAAGAREHLKANRDSMTAEQIAKAKSAIEGQEDDDKAMSIAADIVGKETDPVKRVQKAEEEKDPGLRKKILARIQTLGAREKMEKAEQREKAMNASVEFIKKGVMPPESVLTGLDERDRWQIEREAEAMRERAIRRAEGRGRVLGGRGASKSMGVDVETFAKVQQMALADPESFLAYNPEQNYGTLGERGVKAVQKLQDALRKGMSDQFEKAGKEFDQFCAGEGKKLSEKEKVRARAVALRNYTNAWWASNGNVTNAQLMGIIKDAAESKTEDSGFFGGRKEGGSFASSEWDKTNHGAAQKRKYFSDEDNAQAAAAMRAGVVVNGRRRVWNRAIGPDQTYCFQIWSRGTHDYPDEWVLDAKSQIEAFNSRHPDRKIPVNRRNIESVILERRMTLNDEFLKE